MFATDIIAEIGVYLCENDWLILLKTCKTYYHNNSIKYHRNTKRFNMYICEKLLEDAIKYNNIEIVKLFSRCEMGHLYLNNQIYQLIAKKDNLQILNLILNISTVKNVPELFKEIYGLACYFGKKNIVQYYLDHENVQPDDNIKGIIVDAYSELEKNIFGRCANGRYRDKISCFELIEKGGHENIALLILADKRISLKYDYFKTACKCGWLHIVRMLLKTQGYPWNTSSLSVACANGQLEVVKILLKDNRFSAVCNDNLIATAAINNHTQTVHFLIKERKIQINNHSENIFKYTLRNGDFETAMYTLQSSKFSLKGDWLEITRHAFQYPHQEILKTIIMMRPEYNYLGTYQKHDLVKLLLADETLDIHHYYKYALKSAIGNNNFHMIKQLLETKRVDSKIKDELAIYSLTEDLRHDPVPIVTVFRECNVEITACDGLLLKWATHNRHYTLLLSLIKDPTVDMSTVEHYLISDLCLCGQKNILDILLARCGTQNSNPPEKVSKEKFVEPQLRLISHNPNININHAIIEAFKKGYYDAVKQMILTRKVDPSVQNNCLIKLAASKGMYDITNLLLKDERVDPAAENNYALIEAFNNKHYHVIKLLLADKRVGPTVYNNLLLKRCMNGCFDINRSESLMEIVVILLTNEKIKTALALNKTLLMLVKSWIIKRQEWFNINQDAYKSIAYISTLIS
jgi:hypothetical protein